MTWTTDKPTVTGWYWWRKRAWKVPVIYEIEHSEHGQWLIVDPGGLDTLLTDIGGDWAGPILPPEN